MSSLQGLSPALIIVVGAFVVPLLGHRLRNVYMLALPAVAFAVLLSMPDGDHGTLQYMGLELVTLRVDDWSRIFSYIFLLATALSVVYAWHIRDWVQQVAGLVYAGGAVGAVLAGDFLTLFVYWEVTALSSVFLVWASRTDASYRSGMRYVAVQLLSGLLLLVGALALYNQSGSLRFEHVGLEGLGGWLIFLAFDIKCAFPFLHNWLQDAYPQATVTGTVFLSAFTTKLAVYALARGFAGTEELIWIGALMTAFPIFYAVIENDLRRVLAYSLNNQLGFMVVGIGIGTELALNGTAAHAFCHILYKALLFMSMGAVLLRAGTANGSELGGLYKSMPWTTGFCIVGAASISAFPLFSGFVSKSLIITAVALEGHFWVWAILLFASAGVFHHSGIKIPYFAFFAHDSGIRCKEAPWNMLMAMAVASALCIGIGVYPDWLYSLLPFAVDYQPYTAAHVLTQLQLLVFSALAFSVLMWHGIYPPELRSVNLDFDYFYRRFPRLVLGVLGPPSRGLWFALGSSLERKALQVGRYFARTYGPGEGIAKVSASNAMTIAVLAVFAGMLLFFYLR
jgi:multicomponent Na+:H+ antiporter subunit D